MKKEFIIQALLAAAFPLLGSLASAAVDVAVAQAENKPKAVNTTVDNTADSAFASDLKAAEDLLRGLSHERKMTPKQSSEYMAKEMERTRKYLAFAKSTLVPHSMSIIKKMKDPDGLIGEGKAMVEKDAASWQGYDYVASGSLLKKDMDGAMTNFQKAHAAAPEFQKDWYQYMLASCYSGKKEPAKALELYEGVIERNDNWLAVKSSYMGASMLLLGKDNAKAVAYFDKGFSLYTPGEQAVLLKTSLCGKFKGLEKGPQACVKAD
ncbi:MAG TPA: hypothetical protein DCZ93_10815 [Elusimicrobia bacterium]|nr:MAG: hypothetical protein A2X35_10010 [Elusimicrobia bacterium GWA2_61_42]OGR76646.1 MAG: hypothetical protein A2X38_03660 [Elusimicrobia bacterium GWC2_61_25]HBB67765.1 hypothetical protein [Elusimicrobiota bacterium]